MHTGRANEQAAVRRLHLGDTQLTYVSDGAMEITTDGFFPDVPPEHWTPETLTPSGRVAAPVGALLVERAGRRLLIDAGLGPNRLDARIGATNSGALLETLAALGHRPEDIEAVAFTHLHTDHTGWAFTHGPAPDGPLRKTFPVARYLVVEQEWGPYARGEIGLGAPPRAELVEPLAGVRTPVEDGEEVFPGVRALVTPGHSPGHAAFVVEPDGTDGTDGGEPPEAGRGQEHGAVRVLVFGDAFHLPGQITHPEWPSGADLDPAGVRDARDRLLRELEAPGTLGFAFHFGDQSFGRVVRDASGARHWQPVPAPAVLPAPRRIEA